jgi:glycogen debranching enzyme
VVLTLDPAAEWLEADGLGGFASGTVGGLRTRRYHAVLLAAARPPAARFVLVNGFDARVTTAGGAFALSRQRYRPDVVHPAVDGRRLERFSTEPWPCWHWRLDDGTRVEQQLCVPRGRAEVVVSWRLLDPGGAVLGVRPFFSGRDVHALHHENASFDFEPRRTDEGLCWQPYDGVPAVIASSNGAYRHDPHWYRGFLYDEERARGLDHVEDLAAPGEWTWDLGQGEALLVLRAEAPSLPGAGSAEVWRDVERMRQAESARRAALGPRLHRAAEAYVVRRASVGRLAPGVNPGARALGAHAAARLRPQTPVGPLAPGGATVMAGYPWFTDWGRDTFIGLRGLCLATGRLDEARGVLLAWAGEVREGLLPNRFADDGSLPEFNSVDAALWYVVAVHDFLRASADAGTLRAGDEAALQAACAAILEGYARGTRHGIRADADGLLACGEPGWQLTWMDARVDGREVTPRIGKPVEVQALWLNALRIGAAFDARWREPFARGSAAFGARFWNEDTGALHDVVDADHRPGAVDPAFRPNQVLAVGGLPHALLDGARARSLVDAVERRLWTPMGLRTLAPDAPGYRGRCEGSPAERDGAYHQGTVWPWLIGPFVEAWVRVRGGGAEALAQARTRFLQPLIDHLGQAGLDHVSEIADGDPPHTPRGCPFQAWSVGELVRALALTAPAAEPR